MDLGSAGLCSGSLLWRDSRSVVSFEISDALFPPRVGPPVSAGRPDDPASGTERMVGPQNQPGSVSPASQLAASGDTACDVSIVIPARNEELWLAETLKAALAAVDSVRHQGQSAEIVVVDNFSTDGTWALVQNFTLEHGIRSVRLSALGAAKARNYGRQIATGRILVFVDADTHLPADALLRILNWCDREGKQGGITRLAGLDGGFKAWLWWTFWEHVRRLPLSRAKAMPAVMFATAATFDEFGPFDEEVAIGEEWPILANLYYYRPQQFVYDRTLTGLTSSRRMERQRFGYMRTLFKYLWAILHKQGRIHYSDRIR
jgi:glycosyltransferase involved in cell wall biosynthesis